MPFIKLEKLINLHDGYQQCINANGHSLLLLHENNRSKLYLNRCPHKLQSLGEGCLHNKVIRCPWHGLEFDLDTGRCLNNNSQHLQLTQFELAYEGSFIGIYSD